MEKPWKVIVAFVGVFIAGSVFGGLLALRLNQRDLAPRFSPAAVTLRSGPAPAHGQPALAPAQPQANPQVPRLTAAVPQLQLPPGMAVQAPQLMRRYVERLGLTAEQKERINPLIQRAAADLRRQQQTNFRETGIIFQHLQEDLGKELTPAQRGRLDEMAEHQRQIIEQRERQQAEKQRAEKQRAQPGQKPAVKDGGKPRKAGGKPVDDGN
jgi:hypothetical protein